MKIGSFTVELLSEGRFEFFSDGHINRFPVDDESHLQPAIFSTSSSMVGINPVLVKTDSNTLLFDTGLGWGMDSGSANKNVSNIGNNLEIFGVRPSDITHVILSHLHYDHAAGCSFTNAEVKTVATFPNATYYVHEKEWNFALSKTDQPYAKDVGYRLDDFYRLMADNKVALLSENSTTIQEGITVEWTGGHTPGHQIVHLQSMGKHIYFLGDLISSPVHLNHFETRKVDSNPLRAKRVRIQLLRKAFRQNAVLLFYHSTRMHSGRLIKTEDELYALEEITEF